MVKSRTPHHGAGSESSCVLGRSRSRIGEWSDPMQPSRLCAPTTFMSIVSVYADMLALIFLLDCDCSATA